MGLRVFISLCLICANFGWSSCEEIQTALEAAYRGESFDGATVQTRRRVVTLLDHQSDPAIPDFECSAPIHIAASGVKLIGSGDVLIKLKEHANAPLILIGPTKSYPGDAYLQLSEAEKRAFRVRQI